MCIRDSLADDPQDRPLATEVSTRRAVELAKISEDAYARTKDDVSWKYRPVYICLLYTSRCV